MRTENWCGNEIRFVEIKGEWYAILKDVCDALDLQVGKVSQRLDPDMLERVEVGVEVPSKHVHSQKFWMLAVNELGIYEALFASRRLEARKFRRWSAGVMQKLRNKVGLQGYEALKLTDPTYQEQIDGILDSLYWDDEKKCIMQSVTVTGGDAEQVPFK